MEDIFKNLNDQYNYDNGYSDLDSTTGAVQDVDSDATSDVTVTAKAGEVGTSDIEVSETTMHNFKVKDANKNDADAFGFAIDTISQDDSETDITTSTVVYAGIDANGGTVNAANEASSSTATTASLVASGGQIGVNSSKDHVDTANGEVGLTVTAKRSGIENQISGLTISVADSEGNVKKSANAALDQFSTQIYAKNASDANEMSFQVGASANQSISVSLDDMRAESLGLKGSDGTKVSVATQDKANAAVDVFDNAIQKALDQQTTIGSVEARLDYTSSNLTTMSENVQSAESTIRDADMAKEMTNYTKNNVLLQAAQSMLAQANQSSSAVLSLLQ